MISSSFYDFGITFNVVHCSLTTIIITESVLERSHPWSRTFLYYSSKIKRRLIYYILFTTSTISELMRRSSIHHSMISSSFYDLLQIIILWYHHHSMISELVLRSFSHTDYDLGYAFTFSEIPSQPLPFRPINVSYRRHSIINIAVLFTTEERNNGPAVIESSP